MYHWYINTCQCFCLYAFLLFTSEVIQYLEVWFLDNYRLDPIQWILPALSRLQYTLHNPSSKVILNIGIVFRSRTISFFLCILMGFAHHLSSVTSAGNMAWQQLIIEPSVKVEVMKNYLNGGKCWVGGHQCRASCVYLDGAFKIESTQMNEWKYTFFCLNKSLIICT